MRAFAILLCLAFLLHPAIAQPQTTPGFAWSVDLQQNYWIFPNIVYSVANNFECRLDVYSYRGTKERTPTVVLIHGGGWVSGTKEGTLFSAMPYLEMGFTVVNVEYRLTKVSPAPAAVEDCRLALRWVFKNAQKYGFDTTRVIVTGGSAGGHLALMTGMLDSTAGFDSPKEWDQVNPPLRVAAIVNWFGITDVEDLLSGENRQQYAVSWIGSAADGRALARRVSPLTYVRRDTPPILSIHGDKDDLVPYEHAVRLHKALDKAGVPNQLITIPGGHHGGFTRDQMNDIFKTIREFLVKYGVLR
jgi:acetyl esterase/lipase